MEDKTRLIVVALAAALIALAAPARTRAQQGAPLKGVWKAVEVGAGAQTVKIVGLAIFTDTHYSIMYFAASPERPDIADVSKASADDMRALWNGWVANTGTYERSGDLVTIHPAGAKNPVVMKPGSTEVYRATVDTSTLSWTQQRNARGVAVANAPTTRFVREE